MNNLNLNKLTKRIQTKKFYTLLAASLVIFFAVLTPLFVDAQTASGQREATKLQNPLGSGNDSLTAFANSVVDAVVTVGLPIAALMIVYSGFLFVAARGNETKLKDAKNAFLYAVIGIAIILAAKVLSEVIRGTIDALRG
ncbi:MAG: hypothetical protein LiPW30_409 [Parcubacteria group bacterium LiPW_30]|nr:MAG: hypothetical protein LiPW30_409 [Parcubacteria group bacterium LiPW_30]